MKKQVVSLYVLLTVIATSIFSLPVFAASDQITMYSLDGRTISVSKTDEEAYKQVGWYSFPPTIVYAPDGRQQAINKNDLNAWLAVGWYSEPMATVYAADGRNLVIPASQIEAYKAVGWYYTITMYAPDGRTAEVAYPDVQAWINVGWSTEPVVTMYSTDDRTIAVPASQIEAYKAVGWLTHEQYQAHVQKKQNQMLDVYASVLIRQYRSRMKDPSSFKLNSVYAGYDSSLYSGYNFVAIVDVSGKNSYGGVTRSTYTMLLETGSGKYMIDLKGYADNQADGAWGSNKLKWMDVSINALKAQANASQKYTKLDTNMITRLVLSN